MSDAPILGWTTESRFGCSNPIRAGDLLVTRTNLKGRRFFPIGTACIALGPAEDQTVRGDGGCISVMIDGVIENMHLGHLEFPSEAG